MKLLPGSRERSARLVTCSSSAVAVAGVRFRDVESRDMSRGRVGVWVNFISVAGMD